MITKNKKVLLGVCGGISCYKALEIVRILQKKDFEVKVLMTKSATEFIKPLAFQTLSKQTVATQLFDLEEENKIGHIKLAQSYPIFLIAPATANTLSKMASGIADDLLTTVFLATNAKVIIAPAMNELMWNNRIIQDNIRRLIEQQGVVLVPPESGYLACETIGAGRLAAIDLIIDKIIADPQVPLKGLKALITLGATVQPIDAFRFISNPSSGKMGCALALALHVMGADTTVIAGITHSIPTIVANKVINVKTTAEMATAFKSESFNKDIIIKTAAVSDYQGSYHKTKLKGDKINLSLQKAPHILQSFAKIKPDKTTLVGFAAESQAIVQNARKKIMPGIDMIVANQIGQEDSGFGSDYNKVTLIGNDFEVDLPKMKKAEVADQIVQKIISIRKKNKL